MHIQPHADILVVAKSGDQLACKCLVIAEKLGCKTQIVQDGQYAPIGSIALYEGYNEQWPSRVFRVAAHTLYHGRPEWAITTPFLVAIRRPSGSRSSSPEEIMQAAVTDLILMYTRWLSGKHGNDIPWEGVKNKRTTRQEALEEWFDLVAEALGTERTLALLRMQANYDKIRGRGGDIVFNHLVGTRRIVLNRVDLPTDLPANEVYRRLCGFDRPTVSYGTSDLANLFELLQTLKLAHVLGLPAGFESYPGAHNWGYWFDGFLLPSLKMLGLSADIGFIGLKAEDKYIKPVSRKTLVSGLKQVGLTSIAEEAGRWADAPLSLIYKKAMMQAAEEIMAVLGIGVQFDITTTEALCHETAIWHMYPDELSDLVGDQAGHRVVILNKPNGIHVYSGQYSLPKVPVNELMDQGWWLGGAVLYHLIYSIGKSGGLVVMVKDSTAGRVNLLARPYLEDPDCLLYLAPVGLFRLTASGQNEDWSIDPLVMLELMRRWGPDQLKVEALRIWNAMEVPLRQEHIGRKTVATIKPEGIEISVIDV